MAEIIIGPDGLCTCGPGDQCVCKDAHNTGSGYRCNKHMIEAAGHRTIREPDMMKRKSPANIENVILEERLKDLELQMIQFERAIAKSDLRADYIDFPIPEIFRLLYEEFKQHYDDDGILPEIKHILDEVESRVESSHNGRALTLLKHELDRYRNSKLYHDDIINIIRKVEKKYGL